MTEISLSEARRIALAAQGLATPDSFGLGLVGAKNAIEHLGYVQIDTISVVERAHNHVWWSRVSDFAPATLDRLLAERHIFEFWSHAASYLPMRDYRYSLPRKKLFKTGERVWFKPTPENLKLKKRIMARIRAEGPLSTRAFAAAEGPKRTGWWDWKPAKKALEQLLMEGRLMISARHGFQKFYDLTERVLPEGIDTRLPSPSEYARHLTASTVRAHGLIRADEIAYLRPSLRADVTRACAQMLREGELEELRVHGMDRPYFAARGKWQDLVQSALTDRMQILSPFDNHLIQRKRLKELFGFAYTIECYVPEPKRRYGYFTLPVLHGDRFAGRLDAKAERARGALSVRSLHAEPGTVRKPELWRRAQPALKAFARFNGCELLEKSFR